MEKKNLKTTEITVNFDKWHDELLTKLDENGVNRWKLIKKILKIRQNKYLNFLKHEMLNPVFLQHLNCYFSGAVCASVCLSECLSEWVSVCLSAKKNFLMVAHIKKC